MLHQKNSYIIQIIIIIKKNDVIINQKQIIKIKALPKNIPKKLQKNKPTPKKNKIKKPPQNHKILKFPKKIPKQKTKKNK